VSRNKGSGVRSARLYVGVGRRKQVVMLPRNFKKETQKHKSHFDHCGGGLVVFGGSVLVDGHGDKLHCLGIHFGPHVMVLLSSGK
jgi:hypothetical protein